MKLEEQLNTKGIEVQELSIDTLQNLLRITNTNFKEVGLYEVLLKNNILKSLDETSNIYSDLNEIIKFTYGKDRLIKTGNELRAQLGQIINKYSPVSNEEFQKYFSNVI